MDFHKLKLGRYQNIAVMTPPDEIVLPFKPAEGAFDCLLAFVQTHSELDKAIERMNQSQINTAFIVAYPKGASKRYKAEINRDSIVAKTIGSGRFKGPRLVSLDKDWSGFSFKWAGT